MKKVLSILVLALVAVQFAFAGDVITQDAKQLPLTARNFINQYFSKPHISHIKIESEILQTKKYEVLLTDRTEIDFDKKGNWLEVDCKKSAVPEALIPVPVKDCLKWAACFAIRAVVLRQSLSSGWLSRKPLQ